MRREGASSCLGSEIIVQVLLVKYRMAATSVHGLTNLKFGIVFWMAFKIVLQLNGTKSNTIVKYNLTKCSNTLEI